MRLVLLFLEKIPRFPECDMSSDLSRADLHDLIFYSWFYRFLVFCFSWILWNFRVFGEFVKVIRWKGGELIDCLILHWFEINFGQGLEIPSTLLLVQWFWPEFDSRYWIIHDWSIKLNAPRASINHSTHN